MSVLYLISARLMMCFFIIREGGVCNTAKGSVGFGIIVNCKWATIPLSGAYAKLLISCRTAPSITIQTPHFIRIFFFWICFIFLSTSSSKVPPSMNSSNRGELKEINKTPIIVRISPNELRMILISIFIDIWYHRLFNLDYSSLMLSYSCWLSANSVSIIFTSS